MILEAVYEPVFLDCSHGFRPNRSCHTALKSIKKGFNGIRWFVEGDIKGCFDNIDHSALVGIISQKIKDARLIKLIWKMLKAGYCEDWQYHMTYSGTPQGGICSPIFANIYLHELDKFVVNLAKNFDKPKTQKFTPEYQKIASKLEYIRKKLKTAEGEKKAELLERRKVLRKELLRTPSKSQTDKKLKYVRYADDFLIGVNGSKEDCAQIKRQLSEFIAGTLKMELSEEKTLITHSNEYARFLGYDVRVRRNGQIKHGGPGKRTKRTLNGMVELCVPFEDMEEALSGNALAMHDLGKMFADGTGVDADAEQAQSWYAKALAAFQAVEWKRTNRYAEYRIGKMYAVGLGTEQDSTAATGWFSKAAERGHQHAQYTLAKLYSHGKGVPRDDNKALAWFEKAASQGNPHAMYQAAKRILADPAAHSERINQAVDWLTQAAEADLDYAQYALGKLYRDGGPVERDRLQAVIWFSQASEQGSQYAMYALGKLHLDADDPAAALRWFRKSAELGNQYAQYRLGRLLLNGDGVTKDTADAVRLLTESAEQGNQYAQYALGKLYLLGKDIPQDRDSAVRWFTQAAEQGNQYAQFFLDHMNDVPSLFASATRLLHHMGRVFQDQAPPPTGGVSFVDSKLRKKIREKKIAMGHKPDDHEEQIQQFQ